MWEALEAAQIKPLVESLPDGLDTVVGERGYRLSGGERQRLAIARLLLKAPRIVVLDEATAHLDSESEAAVQQALRTALTGRTSLVIAHRLSTIREADQILVIDEGRIVERGHHEELLEAGGLYADLYWTQFARQETVGAGLEPGPLGEHYVPDHVPPHLLQEFPPHPPHRQGRPDQPRPPDRPRQLPGFNDLGPPGRPRHGGPDSGNGPAPFGGP